MTSACDISLPVDVNDLLTCGCVCAGKPEPIIKWFKAHKEVTSSPDFQISYKDGRVSLTIPEVFEEDGGLFECQASNKGGLTKSTAELIVRG